MSTVDMRVSARLLQAMFKLPEGAFKVSNASYNPETDTVVFSLKTDLAPDGASEMEPVYHRDHTIPDPVELTSIEWKPGCAACRRSGICGCVNNGPKVTCVVENTANLTDAQINDAFRRGVMRSRS
ncbi:hypothetical protein ACFORO_12465 [Amycolatopsis halotolerans]|uniref:Uncharacterized protein n=1 Tax=Amycolatopsis halotolerans TaxID=330083 RepID=A0ABV7QGA3_9PSEU